VDSSMVASARIQYSCVSAIIVVILNDITENVL
jgi:hypothetical protein